MVADAILGRVQEGEVGQERYGKQQWSFFYILIYSLLL
jgi:hypothetical protein